jgi:hypothetical protein
MLRNEDVSFLAEGGRFDADLGGFEKASTAAPTGLRLTL